MIIILLTKVIKCKAKTIKQNCSRSFSANFNKEIWTNREKRNNETAREKRETKGENKSALRNKKRMNRKIIKKERKKDDKMAGSDIKE